jgi:methionyl-tRNA formyltransferase
MKRKVVFMGSPDFALPSLARLLDHYDVVGVVTQPDRPAGRGKKLTPPPVKILAEEHGIQVIQPERLRSGEAFDQLRKWKPEVIVVTAFGQILRQNVLALAPYGCVNVHASYLPRWRGAAPIQAALLHGDTYTGVSIMKLDRGVDTGPVLAKEKVMISPEDNAESLSGKLAEIGADLLVKTLPSYLNGDLVPVPQDDEFATYAKMINKSDGELRFDQSASDLANRVRAFYPWPGTFMFLNENRIKILKAHQVSSDAAKPGYRMIVDNLPAVGTVEGYLVLDELQPAGKKPMTGDVFLRGTRDWLEQ